MMKFIPSAIAAGMVWATFAIAPVAAQSDNGESSASSATSPLETPVEALLPPEEGGIQSTVEVSLGDWDVRTKIAESLNASVSDVPLTVSVEPDLASKVCPVKETDLEQQAVTSPTRTCAAKSAIPELIEAVKKDLASGGGGESEAPDPLAPVDPRTGS
ncbi:hypothetical protein [Fulvimarina manganoxydans]|nr:hypothetical protein [Fulvimarina manganoxydans]